METRLLQQCWFLAGPTACGKSAVGLELAERLNAEILALDSMSLYRGMDVGTAKPSPEERLRVPHHLLDLVDTREEFSVADYLSHAESASEDIVSRGRTPLFVGGTGLYLRSLLRGVFQGPSADWEFRRRLLKESLTQPPDWLHESLQKIDPQSAARLHPRDERRLIRALEIHHLTGRPASAQQNEAPLPEHDRPKHVFWLSPPRGWLHERINARVDQMLALGWIDEVRGLMGPPNRLGRTASQALGYKELIEHLSGGSSLAVAVEQIKARTRQFAKRQHTWFRQLEECTEVTITGRESAREIAESLAIRREPTT